MHDLRALKTKSVHMKSSNCALDVQRKIFYCMHMLIEVYLVM